MWDKPRKTWVFAMAALVHGVEFYEGTTGDFFECGMSAPRRTSPVECANLVKWFESVAQLVEHRPFKALVLGSSPSALTIRISKLE